MVKEITYGTVELWLWPFVLKYCFWIFGLGPWRIVFIFGNIDKGSWVCYGFNSGYL